MTEFKTTIGKAGCHIENLGSLLTQLDIQFGDVTDGKIRIPIEKVPTLVGLTWEKMKETFLECEGKELVVEFGDTVSANAIETILKLILNFLPGANKPTV